ncbi:MAG: TIGR03118 family protein [Chitinophagaceae bacterium]|nr:TIGR03118 family protein [Chitinophagaceae bacterium]
MRANVFMLGLLLTAVSCSKNKTPTPPPVQADYQLTNLVSDVTDFGAGAIDHSLVNAWGIAVNPQGIIWVSNNHSGTSTIYDSTGKTLFGPVAIPSQGMHFGGSPTGIVFNSTNNFAMPGTGAHSRFIFVNEDGTMSAWATGDSTLTVADRSADDAVYKGLALGGEGTTDDFLFAANFKGKKIDVFDKNFNYVGNGAFSDPNIPDDFGPFNIRNIGSKLFVTYARLKGPENEDDQAGPGNGYVDIFNPDGTLAQRFASQGTLNSPWGIAQAPAGSGFPFHSILVGNFGDGRINIYDSTGAFLGQVQSNGQPVTVPGLWAIDFPYNEASIFDPQKLYFTAGPGDENHGLFGFIKKK